MVLSRLLHLARSPTGRLIVAAASGALLLAVAALAARRFTATSWPLARGNPGLLAAVGCLSLVGYAFKAYGWRLLFAADERPQPLALAAANGGASVMGLALPGRFDDVVRVVVVRRYPGSRACVRTLCLSLFMLGLIDSAALAPLAATAALLGNETGLRAGLAVVAGAGVAAAMLVLALPHLARGRHLLRFRLGRWLSPRATPRRDASQAWLLVSCGWLARAVGLFLLLGALGIGFSFPLALLFLCASSAAAALPFGPGGAATQAGAGAAVLIAAGVGASQAVAVAIASQALGVLCGGAILLSAAIWRGFLELSRRHAAAVGGLAVSPLQARGGKP
jgi:uncharacterized membrane protein YbhN (UPF0104 family)